MMHRGSNGMMAALAAGPLLVLALAATSAGGPTADADARALAAEAFSSGLAPGMAVAVVHHDGIAWEEGFGTTGGPSPHAVSPRTRFYIASTTKALTALAAARMAARGAIDLDAPLSRALPGARFPEGISGDTIRVMDLLKHTHGIDSRGPISLRVAYTGDYTNAELLRILSYHHPAPEGRAFAYSNLGYDLIGIVLAPEVTRGWREIVEREVSVPLGMAATTAWRSRVPEDSLAAPFEMGPDGFEPIRLAKDDANMGPAGGHFSTAHDLGRLLVAELDHGRIDGRQIVPAAVIDETQRLHASQDRDFAYFHRFGWGLGWDLGTYEADTLIHRFGSFPGYHSHVSFMPDRDLGVVVLSNGGQAASSLCDIVAAAVYDRALGRDAAARMRARIADAKRGLQEMQAAVAADRAKRAARPQELPHPLEAYAGTYVSPALGTLELRVSDGRLAASMGVADCAVETYDAEKNRLRVELFGGGSVVQVVVPEGASLAQALQFMGQTFERR